MHRLPGPRQGFWVYIFGPLLGAPLGAGAYELLIRPGLPTLTAAPAGDGSASTPPPVVAGQWCADQALLQKLVREACSESCCDPRRDPCGERSDELGLTVLTATRN